jgi:hypothetical protein
MSLDGLNCLPLVFAISEEQQIAVSDSVTFADPNRRWEDSYKCSYEYE